MRTIRRTTRFKRDYKRENRGQYRETLGDDLYDVVSSLASCDTLPEKYKDHPMRGIWNYHRNCHVHPDLILIYSKASQRYLDLVRLGSHSELGI